MRGVGRLGREVRRAADAVRRVLPATPEAHDLRRKVAAVPFWWHSIDVGFGVTTPGAKTAAFLEEESASLELPDVEGLSVLDIGAWDGFYSFLAETRGAARVVACDHFAWALDQEAKDRDKADRRKRQQPIEAFDRVAGLLRFDIETEAIAVGGFEARGVAEFFPPGGKLFDDPTNFWSPNAPCLAGLCAAAGFTRVDVLTEPPRPRPGHAERYRLVAHAFA